MSRVRVLQVITRLIVGGAQETVMDTASLLDRERFQVEVLCGPQTGSEGSLIEEARGRSIPLTILPELRREADPAGDLRALARLARLIQAGRFQVVHTHSSKAGILGRLAARLAGVPVIVHTVHGWSFHAGMPAPAQLAGVALERLAASFSHALVAVTPRDIQKGLRAGIGRPGQYRLIRSAIPLEAFEARRDQREEARRELGLPPEALVLGNVGRFSPQKNPLDWARVAARVAGALPECRLLLVGDGPLRSQVEALLAGCGLAGRSTFTGLRRDIPRLVAAMDVFLLTSLWEGLPRVIPQAMAMGLPVVAYAVDGVAEALRGGETGYACRPGALDEAAGYCLELLKDPQRREALGRRARAFARAEFGLDRMIRQLEGLYWEGLQAVQRQADRRAPLTSGPWPPNTDGSPPSPPS